MNEHANEQAQEQKKVTVKDVLIECKEHLESINLPTKMIMSVGITIAQVAENLGLCIEAMNESDKNKDKEDEKPKLEVLDSGE